MCGCTAPDNCTLGPQEEQEPYGLECGLLRLKYQQKGGKGHDIDNRTDLPEHPFHGLQANHGRAMEHRPHLETDNGRVNSTDARR